MKPSTLLRLTAPLGAFAFLGATMVATVVPNEIQMPGTQPTEVLAPSPSSTCSACHSGVATPETDPYKNWLGSMMAHAGRDALFWAALAVAEQDFDGSGDLCIRCHAGIGWIDGRSTPTDGSALVPDDFDGVTCELCHKLTNPDESELIGEQNAPFIAHDGGAPAEGFYGSGMYVLWASFERLGPYNDPQTPHGWLQSSFHRQSGLCGTCHEVSNPLVGDLAHNNGAQVPLLPGEFSGVLGAPVADKAAFKNPPYAYGVVERTFSEHIASPLSSTRVSDFPTLPALLKKGSLKRSYDAAIAATGTGDYSDGTPRNFTCQSCHMRPDPGFGCALPGTPNRDDQPVHDLTGGNYWMPDAIQYLDGMGKLVGGGGLNATQIASMNDGKARAVRTLKDSAAIDVDGDTVRVHNLTGHKLITGYPEGRRMWLNVRWYDSSDVLLREDGEYGTITGLANGVPTSVETIIDPSDPYLRIYHTKPGIDQEWAAELITLGVPGTTPLEHDRVTGAPAITLADLAAMAPGSAHSSFHFVLNNVTLEDTRIPPYRMDYDDAETRNALPVPATQFGNPGPGGVYDHWDEFTLTPPVGADYAEIDLLYQPTSFEYVQFLQLANDGSNTFLQDVGDDLMDAWLNTGMAAPVVMTSARWGSKDPEIYCTTKVNSQGCSPAIGSTGLPSASADDGFYITAVDMLNQKNGLLFYGQNGPKASPFLGGFLCVKAPTKRTKIRNTGGNPSPANDCSGGMVIDFNEVIASGVNPALVAGSEVWAQWWSRDPASPETTHLTDAIHFTIEN